MTAPDLETPRPPATPEFGAVTPGGPTHTYPASGALTVRKFSVGPYDNNVYVLESDGEALLVDGATDHVRILHELDGVRVLGILQTHNHHDHIEALPALVEALGVPVRAHPADAMPVTAEPLEGGETLSVGPVSVRVLHTPGHTPGSLCYIAEGFLFSGDTLFPGGPGNTFGDAAAFERIMDSLALLFELPDETRVLPGHGSDTRIGLERPHVETWRKRGW
jgi:glyoxylase-like metal-dependent hydrolase (beta-lactamase superfamily II)